MKCEAVLFDLYGTLVDIDNDEDGPPLWEAVARYLYDFGDTRTPDELRRDYLAAIDTAREAGSHSIFERAVTILLGANTGKPEDRVRFYEVFRRSSRKKLALRDFVPETLAALRLQGIKVALVSNAEKALTMVDLKDLNFPLDLFDEVVLSSDVGCEKPAPEIYTIALGRLGVSAAAAIYVGDSLANDVWGPADLEPSMRAIWVTDNQSNAGSLPDSYIGACGTDGSGLLTMINEN